MKDNLAMGRLPENVDTEFELFEEVVMTEVESRNMPSLGTTGWEIASIVAALIILLGILYKNQF